MTDGFWNPFTFSRDFERDIKFTISPNELDRAQMNAVKHAAASTIVSNELGVASARILGHLNEFAQDIIRPGNPNTADDLKDEFNNYIGRFVATHYPGLT